MNILLVDDNPADLFYLKEIIEDETDLDVNIFEATSLHDATRIIKNESVDITLLDLFLPDSSGIETFHKVNSIKEEQNIIVLSGLKDEETALSTVRSGAQDFIIKGEFNGKLLEKTIIYSVERKKNEKLLRVSNQKYIELFQKSPLSLFLVDPNTSAIKQSNKAATDLFGYSPEEFKNTKFKDLFISKVEALEKNMSLAVIKNELQIYVHVVHQEVSFEKDGLQLIQVQDISERVNFERNRMKIINSIQDNERKNFAMELHDGLAQEMVLMNIYTDQIKEKCSDAPEIKQIQGIIKSSMVQIRRLTYNVSPPLLDDGFFEGLKVLFKRFDSVNEMDISLEIEDEDSLSPECMLEESAYNAFRIVQEFLNNSVKHASASNISGHIKQVNHYILIQVVDDGVGFDQENPPNKGMGIDNMSKRAKIYNLELKISSKKEEGTTLELKVPISDFQATKISQENQNDQ